MASLNKTAQQWVCDVQQWAVTGKSCVVVRLFTNTTVNNFVQIWLNCVTYLEPGSTTEQGATEDLRGGDREHHSGPATQEAGPLSSEWLVDSHCTLQMQTNKNCFPDSFLISLCR